MPVYIKDELAHDFYNGFSNGVLWYASTDRFPSHQCTRGEDTIAVKINVYDSHNSFFVICFAVITSDL